MIKEIARAFKKFFRGADLFLLALGLAASVYGVLLISSATRFMPNGSHGYVSRQISVCAAGVVIFVILTVINANVYARFWKFLAAFNFAFIALLFFFGKGDNGNPSWLRFSWLPFDIQPAEIVKVTFVILMAWHMYVVRDKISNFLPMMGVLAHFAAQVGLIFLASRDLGVVLIYVFAFLCMLVAAGVKFRWFAVFGAAGALALPLLWNYVLSGTLKQRLIYYLNPEADPLGAGFQILHAQKAIANGGLFGMGLYRGTETQSGIIPKQWTDFIFTAACEELGFFMSLLAPLLLLVIIGRTLYIGARARDGYCSLICVGVAGIFIFQTLENIGMCIGVLPIIGVTLPFFSYGGSSLLSAFAALGVVSSVRLHPKRTWLSN